MARFSSRLDQVRIAAPCSVDWEQMIGNDRVRFCGQCSLNVYNLSEMTKPEAEDFIAGNEGRLCVRYYRRADGSVLTKNCPVGLRAIRRRMSRVAQAVSTAVISFFAGIGFYGFANWMSPPIRVMGAMEYRPVLVNEPVVTPVTPVMGRPVIERGIPVTGKMLVVRPSVQPVNSRTK